MRSQRIPEGQLLGIDHAQVWTALQLIHRDELSPYTNAPFLTAGDDLVLLVYVPRFRVSEIAALRERVKRSPAVVLYSWQPELIRQHISAAHVQFEHIPESLARRFGLKG